MHAGSRALLFSSLAFAACFAGCALVTSWDGLPIGVAPDAGPDVASDAGAEDSSPEGASPVCLAGRHYCGGNGVVGDPSTLYLCLADGGVAIALPCAHGCARRTGGKDTCICVVGSPYCGNDQILGDKGSLYQCQSDYSGMLLSHCDAGCLVKVNADDACR